MDSVPEGWYPDPERPDLERRWDGIDWTQETRPSVGASGPSPAASPTIPPAVAPPTAAAPAPAPPPRPMTAQGPWSATGGTPTAWSANPIAPSKPANDPVAIIALVMAVLWIAGVGSLAAIALGISALRRQVTGTSRNVAIAAIVLGLIGLIPAVFVVVTVISALAIPTALDQPGQILDQPDRAVEVQLDSDLRGAVIAQETVLLSTGRYTDDLGELRAAGSAPTRSELRIVRASADGYCVEASDADLVRHVTNEQPAPAEGGCPPG